MAFITDIAGAKLRSALASADAMVFFFALWRRRAVDDAQSAMGKTGSVGTRAVESLFFLLLFHDLRRCGLLQATCTAQRAQELCGVAQRSSRSNEVVATHRRQTPSMRPSPWPLPNSAATKPPSLAL